MRRGKIRNRIVGGFVALPIEMMDSPAYHKLKGAAVKVLLLLMRKVKTHNPAERYDYQFPFTFPEAKRKGIPHSTFNRALTQLIELGFIDVVSIGGMRYEGKSFSYYKLSKRWKDYGTPVFEQRWRGHCESVHG